MGIYESCTMVMTYKKQIKKKAYVADSWASNEFMKGIFGENYKAKIETKVASTSTSQSAKKEQRTSGRDITCFKCSDRGHTHAQCPNNHKEEWLDIKSSPSKKTLVVLGENGKEALCKTNNVMELEECQDEEGDNNSNGDSVEACYPEKFNIVLSISLQVCGEAQHDERECLFQICVKVNGEICNITMDSGSQTDCVASSHGTFEARYNEPSYTI